MRVVGAYWRWYRKRMMVFVTSAAMAYGGLLLLAHVASADAILLVLLVVHLPLGLCLVVVVPAECRREALRAVDVAGDLGRVCSRCLYVSDAIGAGGPCPECGRVHPPDVAERWVYTGRNLGDEYLFRRLVRESATLSAPPSASGAGPGRRG